MIKKFEAKVSGAQYRDGNGKIHTCKKGQIVDQKNGRPVLSHHFRCLTPDDDAQAPQVVAAPAAPPMPMPAPARVPPAAGDEPAPMPMPGAANQTSRPGPGRPPKVN
jgi:hypothetical protein